MNIGIVTFWITCCENYGSALQAYALQYVLKKMGHQPFLIRYVGKVHIGTMSLRNALSWIVHRILYFLNFPKRRRIARRIRVRGFEEFWRNRLAVSQIVYNGFAALKRHCPAADMYLAGGDQLWNCFTLDDEGRTWFLDFVPEGKKRIAYSVSLGELRNSKQYLDFMTPLLRKFSFISLRESSGVDICRKCGFDSAVRVCDPTLLLERREWDLAFPTVKPVNDRDAGKVVVYAMNIKCLEELLWDDILRWANDRKLQLTVIPSQGAELVLPPHLFEFPTVERFMELFGETDFIITNSYHGTIFSIIKRKPFVVIPQCGSNALANNRFEELLRLLSLEKRICRSGNIDEIMNTEIDWDAVDVKWRKFRNFSLDFLTTALADCSDLRS